MNPRDDRDFIERELQPWLAEEGMVREPDDLFERVTTGTRGVRQRPGWVVRLVGSSTVGAAAGPATRWREHTMATALGLGTMIIVAALGIGTLGPGLPGEGAVPGAISDAPAPSASPEVPMWVTGTVTSEAVQSYGSSWSEDGIGYAEGPWWTISWEASDPRLSVEGTRRASWHESDPGQVGVGVGTYVLVNQDGRWVGTEHDVGSASENYAMVVLDGAGGYEDLTAMVMIRTDYSSPSTFVGVVTPAELPEFPEAVEPPAE